MKPLPASHITSTFNNILHASSSLTIQTHTSGYIPKFRRLPPLCRLRRTATAPKDEESIILEQKWTQLVEKGIATIIKDESPSFFSRSFVIPKKNKKEWRLISDMRCLNEYIISRKEKIKGLKYILPCIRKHDWIVTFDVADGYFNVPIDKNFRKFFRFNVNNTIYQLNVLPMGLVTSMAAFRAWLKPFVETARTLLPQVSIFTYVDDGFIILPRGSARYARSFANNISHIFKILGLPIKTSKSDWTPRRKFEFLGFIIDTRALTICVPNKKAREVMRQIQKTLKKDRADKLQVRHLASTIGKIIALLPAIRDARLHTRSLYQLQAKVSEGWIMRRRVRLDLDHKSELTWWLKYLQLRRQYPLPNSYEKHELKIVATDASDTTIAAVLISHKNRPHMRQRLSPTQLRYTINTKEALAVLLALHSFNLSNAFVNIRCDNTTVVRGINKWGTKSIQTNKILTIIHEHCYKRNITLTATYIPTHSNRFADYLTRDKIITKEVEQESKDLLRQSKHTGWSLSTNAFKFLCRVQRRRPKALFHETPTKLTSNSLLNFSALAFSHPHTATIQDILPELLRRPGDTLLVVPLWPTAPWFNAVAQSASSLPTILPPEHFAQRHARTKSYPNWTWIGMLVSPKKKRRTCFRHRTFANQDLRTALENCTMMPGKLSEKLCARTWDYLERFLKVMAKSKF